MSFKDLNIEINYGGLESNLITDFYQPLISNSKTYRRSTAFFTGGIFSVAAIGIKDFILNNEGSIQLVTSTIFNKDYIPDNDQHPDIDNLILSLDNLIKHNNSKTITDIVCSLLVNNYLEIKIADVPFPGIHHEKVGIFTDKNGLSVSFSGSINETWSGWNVNSEEFKVFKSWDQSNIYFDSDLKRFNELWLNNRQNVNVYDLPNAVKEKILSFTDDASIEKLEENLHFIEKMQSKENPKISKKLNDNFVNEDTKTRYLMKHQKDVIDDWIESDYFGIVKHATGSGKTLTGIHAIKEWFNENNTVIVLVPSVLLLEQWINEIQQELPDADIYKAGGGEPKKNWIGILRFLTSKQNQSKTVIISTISTCLTDDFYNSIIWGNHLFLLVDEVHNIGSLVPRKILKENVGAGLGLSATPERYGDDEGTNLILKFFKKILKPEFSLLDAINSGRLVPYDHYPFEVTLTESEEENYLELSNKISTIFRMIDDGNNDPILKNQLENLIYKRSDIIKVAQNKIPAALEIIQKDYKEDEHWLIYCQNIDHVTKVRTLLIENNIKSLEYTSSMKSDRKATLDYFDENGGILVAINCLDEGIDIPKLTNAIILSSSQNPRQHIQRRGRVLRKSKNKYLAKIYDGIVLASQDLNSLQERIMITEIKRAYNFAKDSNNLDAESKVKSLSRKYLIDVENFDPENIEDNISFEEE